MLQKMMLIAMMTVASASAGEDRYEFLKECVFQSPTLGDFKVRVFKDYSEHDRAVIVQSSAQPAPVLFDDLVKVVKFDDETGLTVKKVVIPYNVGRITTVKFYENPADAAWGRLKVFYRAGSREQQTEYASERFEVLLSTTCSPVATL
jgi:hypothetical protein